MADGGGRYVSGDALGLVADGLAALITPSPDENTAALLWESVCAGRGVEGVLGVLTAKGFEGLPDIGVASLGGGTARVLVRGVVTAALALEGGGNEVFTAAGSITWDERRIDGATGVTLAAGASDGGVRLPIAEGVVMASSLSIGTISDLSAPEQPVAAPETPVPPPTSDPPTSEPPPTEPRPTETPVADPPVPDPPTPEPVQESTPASEPELGDGGEYDFLFGKTRHSTVEDAAVRPLPDDELGAVNALVAVGEAEVGAAPVNTSATPPDSEQDRPTAESSEPERHPEDESEDSGEPSGPVTKLIDSVPGTWQTPPPPSVFSSAGGDLPSADPLSAEAQRSDPPPAGSPSDLPPVGADSPTAARLATVHAVVCSGVTPARRTPSTAALVASRSPSKNR